MSKKKDSQPWDYYPLLPLFAFTSVKKARKFVKKSTGIDYEFGIDKDGRCTWYENKENGGFCVICLPCKGKTTKQKYAILAHECVHYAQYFAEEIGGKLDDETEAYTMQAAMLACIDQIGEEWFTATPQA